MRINVEVVQPKPKILPTNEITPQIIESIKDFYQRDDISRQAPGVKDHIIHRQDGMKTTIQKRYMAMTVAEAYQMYKDENPDKVVGKSKFASERPNHVMKQSETPRDVCLCRYHENVNLQLRALINKFLRCSHYTPVPSQEVAYVTTSHTNV